MTDIRLEIEEDIIPSQKDLHLHFEEQIKELGLKLNPNNPRDYQDLFLILNVYLSYPSSEQAEKHRKANHLGDLDLRVRRQKREVRETIIRLKNEICNCCGFFVQEKEISSCQSGIKDVNSLGSSTLVFFQTFHNIAFLLLSMLLIYSIFTFATNLSVAQKSSTNGTLDYLSISLGAKANANTTLSGDADTYYLVSSWLGVAMLGCWLILLVVTKKATKKLENEGRSYTSVSDFSVVIEKMPIGYRKDQVQSMMDQYLILVAPQDTGFSQLKVEKYNEAKPFYFNQEEFSDPQLQAAQQKVKLIKEEMMEWISQRMEEEDFSTTPEYRNIKINELLKANEKIEEKKQELIDKIVKKLEKKEEQSTTFVFITFQTVQQRDFFLSYNSNSLLNRIKNFLPCFDKSYRFGAEHQDSKLRDLVIEAAPEPEDINWGNIGFDQCQSLWRKCVTGLATLVMLCVSFVIVYGLSTVQKVNSRERFVSFLISLVIAIINLAITKVIQYTTVFEKVYTNNTFQISLAYKSIMAQLLNSILIPIIVCVYIKDNNVYGQSGLTEDIFILAITNSFFPPLVRLIDPYYIFVFLKYRYYNRPFNKLGLSQYELNFISEKPEFQLGMEYIYLISNFLFTCFFVSLQPIIPCFTLLGLFFMYWIEKSALFTKSQRPIPGIDTINVVMYQLIYFGGVAYALGSLTWAIFLSNLSNQSFRSSIVANLVAAGIGVLIFLFPYEAFLDYKDNSNLKKTYYDRRIYFPAQYDRLNPVTKQDGVREYREFLLKKKQEIERLSAPAQKDIADQLLHLTQNNTHKGHQKAGNNQAAEVARQLFLNQTRNVLDPKLLKQFLVPDTGKNPILDHYASKNELANHAPERMLRASKQYGQRPSDPFAERLSINYSFADKFREDNFRNVYKSTLNLSNLGLNSNQEIERSQHRNYAPSASPNNLDPHSRRQSGIQ